MGTVDALLAPPEIGYGFYAFLFGVTSVQAYTFFRRANSDPWFLKALVIAVWLLGLGCYISVAWGLYEKTVTQYGQPQTLNAIPTGWACGVVFGSLNVAVVQTFLAYRVYRFSKTPYLAILCCILIVFVLCGFLVIASGFSRLTFTEVYARYGWLMVTCLIADTVLDSIVTSSLCYFLLRQRSGVHEKGVLLIDRLIKWTIQTGMITSIAALVTVILYFVSHHTAAWQAVFLLFPGLFSNCLLATLNSRAELVREGLFRLTPTTSGPTPMFTSVLAIDNRIAAEDSFNASTNTMESERISNKGIV